MIVVLFMPRDDDPLSGPITECIEVTESVIVTMGRTWRQVAELGPWDFTHEVVAGEVVARDPAVLAAINRTNAVRRLRARRNALLRNDVDPIVTNPIRWAELSAEQQAAWLAYRQALLDWPEAEADPLNPTPPIAPE